MVSVDRHIDVYVYSLQKVCPVFQKCELYWPEKDGSYGRFEVRVSIVKECDGYTIRDMIIQVR